MNWFQRVMAAARSERAKPDQGGLCVVGSTQSGVYVTDDTALNYSVVWACVRVISETVAQLPWKTYQKTAKGKKELTGDKNTVAWLLHTQPNPEMTAFRFKRLLVTHALTRGNAYAEIERDTSGRPIWLWPIHPDRVRVVREDGVLNYYVNNGNGYSSPIPAADILHFRGLGDDEVMGASVIAKAKESIGLGIAMERFGSSFFGNGANVSGVVSHPSKLSPEAKKNIEDSLKKRAGGKNALSTLVFEEGMKYEKIGIPPEDAQFLESRQFQVTEICRWFRVPPHKVQDLSRATWNNIEHQSIEFVTDTIIPWTCNFEEEVNLKLFGRQQRGVFYTKFALAALLRGDTAARFAAYAQGRQWGWLSVNDIRELEDMNGIGKSGDQYLVPTNMTTPDLLEQFNQSPDEPIPTELAMRALKAGRVLNSARQR
jgi:HK97 family phage portal protein